jgi:Dictyostelium (slime mold) repeat
MGRGGTPTFFATMGHLWPSISGMHPSAMVSSSTEAHVGRAAKLLCVLVFGALLAASPARAMCVSIGDSCDDGDPCTTDDRCVGVCVDGICLGDECAGTAGCSDGDACTDDSCDPGVGCVHARIACDDQNVCTSDDCDPQSGCTHAAISCEDGDACTTDTCDATLGCRHEAVTCDDGDRCTADSCNPETGCVYTDISNSCDDHDACTTDSCDPGTGCTTVPTSCDDQDACTTDTCDPQSGCTHAPVSCDDQDACTADSCDAILGCRHAPIACDDGNRCTADSCNSQVGCVYTDISASCEDHDACTSERCDPQEGCLYQAVGCDDHDACTDDVCVSPTGCIHPPHNCDDHDACTIDSCNPSTGCTYVPVSCDDHNVCTNDVCNPGTGCLPPDPAINKKCDDGDPCTVFDACDAGGGCHGTPMQCPDDACSTHKVCVDGECQGGTGIDCSDGNPCTVDSCDLSKDGCQHIPTAALCEDGDPCTAKSCDKDDGCVKSPLTGPSCDDGDACTVGDTCQAGKCVPGQRTKCADTPCFRERVCLAGTCVGGAPVQCDDRLNCTLDSCDPNRGCVFTPNDDLCVDAGPCFAGVCDPRTGCRQEPLTGPSCDDGNGCTENDHCTAGSCGGRPVSCPADAFDCTTDKCLDGACRHVPTDTLCDAGDCELGVCRPTDAGADKHGCVAVPVAEGEACTDDGFACTDDVCTGRQCLHVPIDNRCGDPEECTRLVCSPERDGSNPAGCVVAPLDALSAAVCAEDGDPCTDDLCSSGRCLHTPVPEVVTCSPVLGAFRKTLGLASLTRSLMAEVEGQNQPSGTGGGSMAALSARLDKVETDLLAASGALSGKVTADQKPSLARTSLPQTPAQLRARIAFVKVRKTPKAVQQFLRLVTEARTRAALQREHARALRRRGRLLLRGTKTLKGELKRLQRVSKSFTR